MRIERLTSFILKEATNFESLVNLHNLCFFNNEFKLLFIKVKSKGNNELSYFKMEDGFAIKYNDESFEIDKLQKMMAEMYVRQFIKNNKINIDYNKFTKVQTCFYSSLFKHPIDLMDIVTSKILEISDITKIKN